MKTETKLDDRIYSILFEKSRVDIVRVLYEDEWPVEELANLIKELLSEKEKEERKTFRSVAVSCKVVFEKLLDADILAKESESDLKLVYENLKEVIEIIDKYNNLNK